MLWSMQEQVEEGLEGQTVGSTCGNSFLSHLIPASSEQQHNNLLNLVWPICLKQLGHRLHQSCLEFAYMRSQGKK